ncbi:MAG: twin-arginine translocation signal domain-containing protein [Gammaproteobacteria bacterium]|jgi:ferric-dicitrate binding protein FerR (iron transport regulator)|nr:twin-arginine translocation signal domain-containing protein [Acidiferrobacteraceae bacterium]MBT6891649.1 twin-arginine translocation signal domain-containing protein [Gammaproteobacteria bacterium]MBT7175418.1 twin-arginine translocation signal domain-containing protein [Gammaproteobacteria bacterium]
MNKIKKQLPKEQSVTTRRAFLKGAASAGGAAALVASTGSAAHETKGPAEASAGTGYRESGHIKDYYKTTQL